MTATETLRRMLDERGVEYEVDDTQISETEWYCVTKLRDGCHDRWTYEESPDCDLLVSYQYDLGAEDAIAATLGRGECRNASKVMDEYGQARFACSECHAWIDSRLLWNPEYRNGESPWVSDCKLNFCPNCGRRIVDPTTNDVDAEVEQ